MFRLDKKTYLIAWERGKEDCDFIALHSAFELLPSVMGPCPCPAPQVKVTISETNPDTFDVSISTNGMIETFKNVTTSKDVPDSIKRAMQSEHT